MNQTTLASAQVGDVCLVTEITQEPVELRSRLYALVIPGAAFKYYGLLAPESHADKSGCHSQHTRD